MVLRKVGHNVFDCFVGTGWNNWRRVELQQHNNIVTAVPTNLGTITLSNTQLTNISGKFNRKH